jgi:hypothetical protein
VVERCNRIIKEGEVKGQTVEYKIDETRKSVLSRMNYPPGTIVCRYCHHDIYEENCDKCAK